MPSRHEATLTTYDKTDEGEPVSRWKLIPTRKSYGAEFVYGSPLDAQTEAAVMSAARACPVMVVEAPEGGLIRVMGTVGGEGQTKVRRTA